MKMQAADILLDVSDLHAGYGKAEVLSPVQTWSPIDGAYVLNCPTYAISVRPEDSAA